MVKKLVKFFAYVLFFIFALILFIPKSSVYFFAEKQLKTFDMVISNETVEDKFFSLNISDASVSMKAIEGATIKETDVTFLLFYNSIELSDIKLSSLVDSFVPSKVESVKVVYTIFDPLNVNASGNGSFGQADVKVSILDRKISVILKPSKKMLSKYKNSLKEFKKDKSGEYKYDKTF